MDQQAYQDFDLELFHAYRKVFFTPTNRKAKEMVMEDLAETFRFWDRDQYEDPKLQSRQLGHRDVILHIMERAGMLNDKRALARAIMNVAGQPPDKKPVRADMGSEDLDL